MPSAETNTYYPTEMVFPSRYIKMKVTGDSFGFTDNRFAMYGFDLFGTLYMNYHSCVHHKTKNFSFIKNLIPLITFDITKISKL